MSFTLYNGYGRRGDGVHAVVSGYIDGHVDNPTYQQVSAGITGHTEAVEISYDPAKVFTTERAARQLLDVLDGLGPDDSGGFFAWAGFTARVETAGDHEEDDQQEGNISHAGHGHFARRHRQKNPGTW